MKKLKPPGAKTKPVYVRVRPEDFERMQNIAWSQKLLISEWARGVLLRVMAEEQSNGK